jgi:hypothetical protein
MTKLTTIGRSIAPITTIAQTTTIVSITSRSTKDGIIGIMRRTTTVSAGAEGERCRPRGGLKECPGPRGATLEAGHPRAGGRACPQVHILKVLPVVPLSTN